MKTVDYAPRHAWDNWLELPVGSVERAVHNNESWREAQLGRINITSYWDDVAHRLKLGADEIKQLAEDFYSGDALDQTLIAYIRQQKANGVTVALLSNDSHHLLRPKLEHLEILSLFDPLVISSEIGVMKPDAGAYEQALHQLGRPATETIFIDDRLENIEAANQIGIHGVHYVAGMDLQAQLDALLSPSS